MKTKFKNILLSIISIFALLTCCRNQKFDKPENEEKPLKYTEINLDEIKDSVDLNLELIWDSSPQPDKRALHSPRNREEYAELLRCLIQGPDSCFYGLDLKLDKLIKFSADGEYLKTIGGSGSGPCEFLWPGWMYSVSNNYIYVYDKDNCRFQMLDINGKYIKDYKNIKQSGYCEYFGVTKNMELITRTEFPDSLLLNRYDSLGKFINKFGFYPYPEYSMEFRRMTNRVILLDSKKEDIIYCVFLDFPIMRKYNYFGTLIEEISLKGKNIEKYWDINKEYVSDYQKAVKKYNGKKLLITSANILNNDNLLINIYDYGTVVFNFQSKNISSKIKYVVNGIHDTNPDIKRGLKYCIINNRIYCNSSNLIFRQI